MTNFEWMFKNDKKTLADLIDGKWNCLYCSYAFKCSESPARCKDGTIEWLLAERNRDWEKEPMTLNDIKRAINAVYGRTAVAEAERNKPKTTADLEETLQSIANLKKILNRKQQIAQYNEAAKGLKDLYDSYIDAGFKEYQAEMLLMEQFKAALMNNKEKEK